MIETAKDYLINNIYDPALQHPEIGDIKGDEPQNEQNVPFKSSF